MRPFPLPILLLTALPTLLAQTPAGGASAPGAPADRSVPNYLMISKRADALLRRENGSRLEIDELPPNTLRTARAMNSGP